MLLLLNILLSLLFVVAGTLIPQGKKLCLSWTGRRENANYEGMHVEYRLWAALLLCYIANGIIHVISNWGKTPSPMRIGSSESFNFLIYFSSFFYCYWPTVVLVLDFFLLQVTFLKLGKTLPFKRNRKVRVKCVFSFARFSPSQDTAAAKTSLTRRPDHLYWCFSRILYRVRIDDA